MRSSRWLKIIIVLTTWVIAVVIINRNIEFIHQRDILLLADLRSLCSTSLVNHSLTDNVWYISNSGSSNNVKSSSYGVQRFLLDSGSHRDRSNVSGILNYRHKPGRSNDSQGLVDGSLGDLPSHSRMSKYRRRFILWEKSRSDILDAVGPEVCSTSAQYLIYRCDTGKMQSCGGLGDRIKGMMVAYIIANLTDRIFKIEMLNPKCDFTQYLMPNLVNWSLPTPFHASLKKIPPDTRILDMMTNRTFYENIQNFNFTELLGTEKYIYFKANLDYSLGFQKSTIYENQLSWMKLLAPDQIQATIFKRLFKLSTQLQSRLQNMLTTELPAPDHRLICAHVRMGKNPTIPNDNVVNLKQGDLGIVWQFLKHHSTTDLQKIFIMSDSENAVKLSKLQDFGDRVIETPGIVRHIDIAKYELGEDRCAAIEKVMFDLHLLMNCDVLLLSNSGLSRLAAYVRGSNEELFCLTKDKRIIPCQTTKLKEIYQVMG